MKLTCNSISLAEASMKVSRALPSKVVNPILDCIKIVAKNNTLTLYATDLEISITKHIVADVIQEGEALVLGKLFNDYIRKIGDTQVELRLENNNLVIVFNENVAQIACLSSEEHPQLNLVKHNKSVKIEQSVLKKLINSTSFAVATDDSRPILKGCYFEIVDEDKLTVVALDGYRIALSRTTIQKDDYIKAIVPSRSINEISKLLEENDEKINIYTDDKLMSLALGDTVITTRLITGQYINYNNIIPTQFETEVIVNKVQLATALDRASIFSRVDKNNLVKLEIKENIMYIKSDYNNGGTDEKIEVTLKGKDIVIAFNAKFIIDCLNAVDCEFIKLQMMTAISPTVITAYNSNDYLYMVVPVRIVN